MLTPTRHTAVKHWFLGIGFYGLLTVLPVCAQQEVLPDLSNDQANTSILNDQLRQTNRRLLALEGGLDINSQTTGILSVSRGGTGQDFSSVAAESLPYFSATGVMGNIGIGTTGYFLQSQGNASAPTWTPVSFTPQGISVITASGTWSRPAGINRVYVHAIGGGGGGGCNTVGTGGTGGGGQYVEGFTNVTGDVSVVVGTGGAGGAVGNHDGSSGNASSFPGVTTITAAAGGGGGTAGGAGSGGTGGTSSIAFNGVAGGAAGQTISNSNQYGFGGAGQTGATPGDSGKDGIVIVYY